MSDMQGVKSPTISIEDLRKLSPEEQLKVLDNMDQQEAVNLEKQLTLKEQGLLGATGMVLNLREAARQAQERQAQSQVK